jgi:hypothetical protein
MHALFRLKPLFVTVLALALLCSLFPLVGCGRLVALTREGPPEDYAIAVIRTTEQDYSTFIEYLDEDLEPLGSVEYPYACVNSTQRYPVHSGDDAFLVVEGPMGRRDGGIIFSFDVNDALIEEYRAGDVGLQYVTVSDGFLFGAYNLNGTSYIDRIDIKTKEKETLELPRQIVEGLAATEGRLAVLACDIGSAGELFSENKPYVAVYSYDFEQTGHFDLLGYEGLGWLHKLEGDRLYFECYNQYFASSDSAGEEPITVPTIHYYSFTENRVVSLVPDDYHVTDASDIIAEDMFMDTILDVIESDEYLLVLSLDHSNVTPEKNSISFFNKGTNQYEQHYTLDDQPVQMELASDGSLLVLGSSSLVRFSLGKGTFTEIDSVALDPNGADDNVHYFNSSFFMRE